MGMTHNFLQVEWKDLCFYTGLWNSKNSKRSSCLKHPSTHSKKELLTTHSHTRCVYSLCKSELQRQRGRGKEWEGRGRERVFTPHWPTPKLDTTATAAPGARDFLGLPTWVAWTPTLGPPSAAILRPSAGSSIASGAAKTRTGTYMGSWLSTCCLHMRFHNAGGP